MAGFERWRKGECAPHWQFWRVDESREMLDKAQPSSSVRSFDLTNSVSVDPFPLQRCQMCTAHPYRPLTNIQPSLLLVGLGHWLGGDNLTIGVIGTDGPEVVLQHSCPHVNLRKIRATTRVRQRQTLERSCCSNCSRPSINRVGSSAGG